MALSAEMRLRAAMADIVAVLGPRSICECEPGDPDCGLRDEAAEALRIAQEVLRAIPSVEGADDIISGDDDFYLAAIERRPDE